MRPVIDKSGFVQLLATQPRHHSSNCASSTSEASKDGSRSFCPVARAACNRTIRDACGLISGRINASQVSEASKASAAAIGFAGLSGTPLNSPCRKHCRMKSAGAGIAPPASTLSTGRREHHSIGKRMMWENRRIRSKCARPAVDWYRRHCNPCRDDGGHRLFEVGRLAYPVQKNCFGIGAGAHDLVSRRDCRSGIESPGIHHEPGGQRAPEHHGL